MPSTNIRHPQALLELVELEKSVKDLPVTENVKIRLINNQMRITHKR